MHRLIGLAALAACYAPQIQAGIPCATGDVCPGDLHCSPATHTCEDSVTDASIADTPRLDGPVDGAQVLCYGSGVVHVCLQQPPSGNQVVSSNTAIDTSDASKCTEVVDGYCVIAHQQIAILGGVSLTATGTRPLVLIGTGSITVDGVLSVSSHRGSARGAGGHPSSCLAVAGTSSGGGAGGSFVGRGGNGGNGATAAGSPASPSSSPATLRGGCDGTSAGQPGGPGGGAVALISPASITVAGTVSAGGAGGTGGVGTDNGGGGGGAGGMIVLDAPMVITRINAAIFANGGGGGKGGANGGNGQSGADATLAGAPASGGTSGNTNGGNGGSGSIGAILTGQNGGDSSGGGGGGGGGGGAGVIRVVPLQFLPGLISPPPT